MVADQVRLVRTMGMHGYCIFRYGILTDEQMQVLQAEVNTEPAVPYYR